MDTNCPYCDAVVEINHDDGYGHQENSKHIQECCECGKTFTFTTSIIFHYEVEKADCLNGGEHDYQRTKTFPIEFSKMQCTMCDARREMTQDERKHFQIGTKQSYFE
jgi:hypothetical protein